MKRCFIALVWLVSCGPPDRLEDPPSYSSETVLKVRPNPAPTLQLKLDPPKGSLELTLDEDAGHLELPDSGQEIYKNPGISPSTTTL